MAFLKGHEKLPNAGRPKGSPNKNTTKVREMFADVFDKLGGADAFVLWAQESNDNKREFYKMYSKLIPTDIYTSSGSINVTFDDSARDL